MSDPAGTTARDSVSTSARDSASASASTSAPASPVDTPVLAEVVRSGFVEARHRGSLVALDSDGSVAFAAGDVEAPIFPRSSNKPLQAVGMLRGGLGSYDLADELIALIAGSHSGEDLHLEGVRRILAAAGLTETALQCPTAIPMDVPARDAWIAAGREPARIAMNCSGKHAGMLATCVAAGQSPGTYLEPESPVQQGILATVEELVGEPVAAVGVDGCGAPLFGFGLAGLARSFRRLALAPAGTPERRVVDAIRAHPEYTSGTRRDERALILGVPGLYAKGGAEACYAAALEDGRAIALKVEDGGGRARPVVMAAALQRLGVRAPVVREQATAPVHGGADESGRPRVVGEIRATLDAALR